MDCPSSVQIESEGKRLKRDVESWRELIVPLYSVLIWEQTAYAGIIPGVTSLIFLIIWYLDPSLLTSIALLGLLFAIADYGIPLITAQFFSPDQWTGSKERKLENFCKHLAEAKVYSLYAIKTFWDLRKTRPKMFYLIAIPILLVLIWIGNNVNNVLLSYITVTSLLLYPGIKHRGFLDPVLAPIGKFLCKTTNNEKKKE